MMDLANRKIALVQTILSLTEHHVIDGIEELLNQELAENQPTEVRPMSLKQFHKEIEQSIEDSENDNGIEANALLAEIKNWK